MNNRRYIPAVFVLALALVRPASAGDAPAMTGMSMEMPAGMDMTPLKMPQLREHGTYVVTGRENWQVRTGFGHNTGMVGMMNQMMIEGYDMGKMKMGPMRMDFGPANFTETEDELGPTPLAPVVAGPVVAAPSPAPVVPQPSPAPTPTPVAIPPANPPTSPAATSPTLTISAKLGGQAVAGDNKLTITVTSSGGKPVAGAKVTVSVAMTSMDMGTSHPPVKETSPGKYQATVNFGMAGPWRATVRVTPLGGKPQTQAFDFNAR